MKIFAYESNDKIPKVTSYKLYFEDIVVLFDCGMKEFSKDIISDLDCIFISHEHLDHSLALFSNGDILSPKIRIFATETTKKVLLGINQNREGLSNKSKITQVINRIESVLFDTEVILTPNTTFSFFPSGHTFGSSMVFLCSNKTSLLYTGDMDLSRSHIDRQYFFKDSFSVDYLIADGTRFNDRYDFKVQSLNKIKNRGNLDHLTFNIKPEKAVYAALSLSNLSDFNKHTIIYEADLSWYLDILLNQGYNPFLLEKIVFDTEGNYECDIKLSAKKYKEFNLDWGLGLHISRDDLMEFIYHYAPKAKVLLGHYDLSDTEIAEVANAYGITLLAPGGNDI